MRGYTDPRYGSSRWRKVRAYVLRRDGWVCWFTGCLRKADVCDHMDRVTRDTTDLEFFDTSRLRASCRRHNLARSLIAIFEGADLEATPVRRFTRPSFASVRSSSVFTRRKAS